MRFCLLLVFTLACMPVKEIKLVPGECVLGKGMAVWKLISMNHGEYMFAVMPVQEGSPLEIVKDISTFKKVECPY